MLDEEELLSGEESEKEQNESNKLLGENQKLTDFLKKLQKPWLDMKSLTIGESETHMEGWLWKKRRRAPGWNHYYFFLNGFQVTYKKSATV
jgi:hypothetical protein